MDDAIISAAPAAWIIFGGVIISDAPSAWTILDGAIISAAPIAWTILDGAIISGAPITWTILDGAIISAAPAAWTILDGAIISAAPAAWIIFDGAIISAAPAAWTILDDAIISAAPVAQLFRLRPLLQLFLIDYFARVRNATSFHIGLAAAELDRLIFLDSGYIIYDYSMDLSSSALDISSPDALSGQWIHRLEYLMDIILNK